MPGRLAIYDDISFKQDIFNTFGTFKDEIQVLHKKYNIAPTISIPIFTNTLHYTYAHFGLIPSWAKDKKSMNINARSETIYEKASFKEAYKQRRCLLLINGHYEWEKDELSGKSIPHIITSKNKNYFALAGIYEQWYDNTTNKILLSTAIITTEPNEKIAKIHDRMPVILEQKDWKKWLDDDTSFYELNKLFKSYPSELIDIEEVGDLVNSVKNDGVECLLKSHRVQMVQESLF